MQGCGYVGLVKEVVQFEAHLRPTNNAHRSTHVGQVIEETDTEMSL